MRDPFFWLVERPIAHRGLHDAAQGIIENSLSATRAAVCAGYAIECDVQATADAEVVVFHDETLERLTDGVGRLDALGLADLQRLTLRGAREQIPTLRELLAAIGGAVPLVIEIKSRFDGSLALARSVAEIVADYRGLVAIESFDPDPIAELRTSGAGFGLFGVALGMVAEASYDGADWSFLSAAQRRELAQFAHAARTRPDFLSWSVADLPHEIPRLCRASGLPVTVWTVRSAAQAKAALAFADQIVFEGFSPASGGAS
ncbi:MULTISPECIES: glycerophosphodiester phosphodiesterase family protein [Methylosinus]|uniref:Glycerophosphodiester phosphodiesterase n=1 Tax=Methylosinus trichosporium (strain ATCC 35070 / NCIMB 11131 / UNIQEM 75 / OB3b) TaxID=595536 RepID=A0A2D2CWQ2_METT3|nr:MULTISPECIES: glycerophosphodiester phosphodiesterase family protein [Methylosinus]ATQ67175.1 glycerophosphodiester phosphodiesterase [Methylosinus trichosporium OB3b]OBS52191.1 glycerophosphodiester phosphodiesterase [Methylosinus sp. 3S-1]